MTYGLIILLIGIALFIGYLIGGDKKFIGKSSPHQRRSPSRTTAPLKMSETQEIQQLLQRNEKIQAIKRYREITGCGLKEAKDAVEQIQAEGDR